MSELGIPNMIPDNFPMSPPVDPTREAWRYHFAGQAMAGMITHGEWETYESFAQKSRELADALLAELERTKP